MKLLSAVALATGVSLSQIASAKSETTHLLFNGKDLSGWNLDVPAMDEDFAVQAPFFVDRGLLVVTGKPMGHLVTQASFRNYRLELQYRFAAGPGNAGVLVHTSTPRVLYKIFPQSIEVQMLDGHAGDFWCIGEDIEVSDMERRRGPEETWGIREGDARRIENLTNNSELPVGQWNTLQVEALERNIRVWVNGELVNEGFNATADRGHIALQSEGAKIEFKNVLLVSLPL